MEIENQVVEDDMVEIIETKKDKWPPHIESHFIALMVEEVKKGNRQTTTLTKPAWKRIKEELKTKFGKEYKKEQFKNKFNGLRGKWKVFHNLIKMETGLRYNASTGQIIASDDEWKKLIEKYKLGKQFRKKGCPHYEKLSIIFGDTTASSANQHPSTKRSSISDDDSERENDFDHEEHSYQTKKKANVGSNSKEGETSRDDVQLVFVEASKNMGESFKRKADVLEKLNTSHFEETNNKLMTCLSILEKLKGIGAAPFTKAVKMLKEDPLWRDVFLALSDARKRDLVLNL